MSVMLSSNLDILDSVMNKAGLISLYCLLWGRWQPIPLDIGLDFFSCKSISVGFKSNMFSINFDIFLIDMTDDGRNISSSVWSGFSFTCYGSNSCRLCLIWWLISNSHLRSLSFVSDIGWFVEISVLWYFEVLSYFIWSFAVHSTFERCTFEGVAYSWECSRCTPTNICKWYSESFVICFWLHSEILL